MSKLKPLERFKKSTLISGSAIGQGSFGTIIEGTLNKLNVAVKVMHAPVGRQRFDVLEQMYNLSHRNVIAFYGIIDTGPHECPQLVFLRATGGNLLDFLHERSSRNCNKVLWNKLACDIINGMVYLHDFNFIHGCLSARNVLLDHFQTHLNAKISDYGMPRVTHGTGPNYYNLGGGKTIPIRWMPKEAVFSDKNAILVPGALDVWSFGVVMWEMWTKGQVPYGATMSNSEVKQNLLNGSNPLTFNRPSNCPPEHMQVMENIFSKSQQDRPTFFDIRKFFKTFDFSSHNNSANPRHPATVSKKQMEAVTKTKETLDRVKKTHHNMESQNMNKPKNIDHRRSRDQKRDVKPIGNHSVKSDVRTSFQSKILNSPVEKNPVEKTTSILGQTFRDVSDRTPPPTFNSSTSTSGGVSLLGAHSSSRYVGVIPSNSNLKPLNTKMPPPLFPNYKLPDAPPPYTAVPPVFVSPTPAPQVSNTSNSSINTTRQENTPTKPAADKSLEETVRKLEKEIADLKLQKKVDKMVEERLRKEMNSNYLFHMGAVNQADSGGSVRSPHRVQTSANVNNIRRSAANPYDNQNVSREAQKPKEPCVIS